MKKVALYALLTLMVFSCRPEPYEEIGPAYEVSVEGEWTMTKVELEDRSFPLWSTMDFTDYYANNPVDIVFNSVDRSYQIAANSLVGLPFTSMQGTYAFNTPSFPTSLYLISMENDTTEVELGSMVREIDPQLVFFNTRSKCGEVYSRYAYTFNRK